MHDSYGSMRTPLKRVRGTGAAKEGTGHFWLQRVTALALIPLSVWFFAELITVILREDRRGLSLWMTNPLVALALAALIVAMFLHAKLGMQVIIEDYVHTEGRKIALLLFTNTLIIGFGAACLLAIARLHFIGI